ncbi:MAG: Ig-like domain-containing protein [Acholeplasmataceae bacterium]
MIKKSFLGILVLISAFVLFACQEDITLSIDDLSVTLEEGDTYQIEFDSNDDLIEFQSSNEEIVTVSDSGLIEAKSDGTATITVTSTKDESISVDIEVTVEKSVTLSVEQTEITLMVGESEQITYTSNEDVIFESSDDNILTVDDEGQILAISDGEAVVTITSTVDDSLFEEVTVTVRKIIELEVTKDSYELWIGKTETIPYTSNDDVHFEVEDDTIASVSASGVITGLSNGMTTIEVISSYDETVKEMVTVRVYNDAETIIITGQNTVNVNTTTSLNAEVGPDDAYEYVTWSSSDESIATISTDGVLTALQTGNVVVTAVSDFDASITATFEIEIVNYLVVDETKVANDTVEYVGVNFEYGVDLFTTIQEAIDVAEEGAIIYVFAGTYEPPFTIDVAHVTIEGLTDAQINGDIIVNANDITIKNLSFSGDVSITNTGNIDGFVFHSNIVEDVVATTAFMHLDGVSNLEIKENTFTNLSGHAIVVGNYLSGLINIYKNTITTADTAIIVAAVDNYDSETKVHIERNIISEVSVGIDIETISAIDIEDYVRFNQVSNYNTLAAKANVDHRVDFTLNYWGEETPVYADFENITTHDLRGFYADPTKIVSEAKYNPLVPVMIVPEYTELEAVMGETHLLGYEALPIGSTASSIKYITSDSDILRVYSNGTLDLVRSGSATVTLLLGTDFTVNAKVNVMITTTPGIELSPSVVTNTLLVGDVFSLNAEVFPFAIKDEDVTFESSDIAIATINQEGVVTSHAPGLVTFKAKLVSDPTVETEFKVEFFASLDDNDLLDMLTMNQVNYTTPHSWIAYGNGYNYNDFKYESVSRYYFGDLEANKSKMVPVSAGIRPGEPMDPHPSGVTQYNPYNVYWVVIHDTANTSSGSGALAHANYLWNAAQNGTELLASWHFTMDDKYLYQHLPETERGYHAGDGGTLAGTTWIDKYENEHIGGGNRNGIGIEMGVNDDADVYRIWQRTAKLTAELLTKYNLPRENMKYHNDFSGKDCPNTLRNAGLIPLYEKFADIEYKVASMYSDAEITFTSNNPEFLDNTGRIIEMPDRAMTVSYTITVNVNDVETSRTFYSYLPGTIH